MAASALWRLPSKPYFLFRPAQVLRRVGVLRGSKRVSPGLLEVELPWGMSLCVREHEKTTLEILRRGLFDLTVSETLFRLADPGELAVDVGGNVGHMTSVLARRVGRFGEVMTFEPHPRINADLRANVERWTRLPDAPHFRVYSCALSSEAGSVDLRMDEHFDWNQGSATLSVEHGRDVGFHAVKVSAQRLDEVLGSRQVGVLKADVEGFEIEVFKGAERALRERRIRDVLFEDFDEPPTATATLLEGWGYEVFALDQGILGPAVGPATEQAARRSGDDPSYLATADPGRALERLRARGWRALGFPPSLPARLTRSA